MLFLFLKGMKYDYHIELMEPDTPWRFNVKELVLRNKHGVSKDTIQKMVDRYQPGVTVESIMGKKWIQNNILEKQKAAAELVVLKLLLENTNNLIFFQES